MLLRVDNAVGFAVVLLDAEAFEVVPICRLLNSRIHFQDLHLVQVEFPLDVPAEKEHLYREEKKK
jgi:hypothetical protein